MGLLHSIDKKLRLVEVSNHWLERLATSAAKFSAAPSLRSLFATSRKTPTMRRLKKRFITTARHPGLGGIAEGAETRAQVDVLRHRGCLEMHGFHFARPLLPDEISARLGQKGSSGAFCLYEP